MFSRWLARNRAVLHDRSFWAAWTMSLLLLAATLVVNYFSGLYATERASSPVTDIVLSNIRVYDVDIIFVQGAILFWSGVTLLLLWDLRLGPFVMKSLSLFILIRSFFTSLTHLGPYPARLAVNYGAILGKVTFGGDLFFSGHAGMPFLIALLFWNNKVIRYISLAASVTLGTSALLGHYHYSIDVFAAYFITYSISHLARVAFPADLKVFRESKLAAES